MIDDLLKVTPLVSEGVGIQSQAGLVPTRKRFPTHCTT